MASKRASRAPAPSASSQAEPDFDRDSAHESACGSVRQDGSDVLIVVRARPRAHAEKIGFQREGTANGAIESLLARALGRAASTCSVARGHRSRDKIVRVQNMDAEDARQALEAIARAKD